MYQRNRLFAGTSISLLRATLLLQTDLAAAEYKRAVALQPGYVTAWNNLGDACEKNKQWRWGSNHFGMEKKDERHRLLVHWSKVV